MSKVIFWTGLACITYVYLGYPLLLMLWRRLMARPVRKRYCEPAVSLVVVMHNERRNVHARMQNCFDLDYPADKLQIVVSLDAPTDGTDSLMSDYTGHSVVVIPCPVREGKAAALNRGMAAATGEIVVFADARQRFDRAAVRELVANFADPSVGAVSGELILLDGDGKESSDGVGLYWRYEKKLRALESDIHSIPGATGAIYAIRRDLFWPLKPLTVLDDVVIPMRIVLGGKRAIFDPKAIAYDMVAKCPESEYEKKQRTLMGNYQLLVEMPELLLPWRNPIFLQLTSHKVGRLVAPYCLVGLFVSNLFLRDGVYLVCLMGQVAWYVLAYVGWLTSARGETKSQVMQPGRRPVRSAYDEQSW
jgi:cellulose synthase/poly-beta-1,6-N-acetylglucosamine synthase-like glycosyltransferase